MKLPLTILFVRGCGLRKFFDPWVYIYMMDHAHSCTELGFFIPAAPLGKPTLVSHLLRNTYDEVSASG